MLVVGFLSMFQTVNAESCVYSEFGRGSWDGECTDEYNPPGKVCDVNPAYYCADDELCCAPICNEDGTCEEGAGETATNCASDCGGGVIPPYCLNPAICYDGTSVCPAGTTPGTSSDGTGKCGPTSICCINSGTGTPYCTTGSCYSGVSSCPAGTTPATSSDGTGSCGAGSLCCLKSGGGGLPPGGGGFGGGCPTGMVAVGATCVADDTGLSDTPIYLLIINLMRWLLYIFGTFAIIAFVIAGIMYLMAAGDTSMADKAKSYVISAVIGVVVALAGLIILNAVDWWLFGSDRF